MLVILDLGASLASVQKISSVPTVSGLPIPLFNMADCSQTLCVLGLDAIQSSWMSKEAILNTLMLATPNGIAAIVSHLPQVEFQAWMLIPPDSCKAKVKDKQCYEPPDKNSQYCKEHSKDFQCKIPKCDSDRDDSERYCKKHHCEVADCHRRTLNLADGEMAGRDKKKCYRHQPCDASRECKNYSLWDSEKTPTKLCANHSKCQFLHGCNGFAQGDSRFCTEHECDQPGCLQPRDVHNSQTMRWCHMRMYLLPPALQS